MQHYAVKQLAKLAGVSVRTLHLYDQLHLLKPSTRSSVGYRQYGEAELLRLQQILFYRELDFPLKEIGPILDDPNFNLIKALEGHKAALTTRRDRLTTLMRTVDNTIANLKNKTMNNYDELYEGMPKEQAAYRNEAIAKWGEDAITRSENALLEMPKMNLERLKADQKEIANQLKFKFLAGEAPESDTVQEQIARHYANIRGFWGVSDPTDLKTSQYKGLAQLYVTDERYTATNNQPDPAFANFMRLGMVYFADKMLCG